MGKKNNELSSQITHYNAFKNKILSSTVISVHQRTTNLFGFALQSYPFFLLNKLFSRNTFEINNFKSHKYF